jgi:hypothetical protein
MESENGPDGKPLKEPFPNHSSSAPFVFFSRLEDEVDGSTEGIVFRQILGRPQQHDHMAVMAAGVHLPLVSGCVRKAGGFRDVEGVHIGPQTDGGMIRPASSDRTHDTGARETPVDVKAEGNEFFGNEAGCLPL